jgi:hypothetical protein
MSEKDLSFGKFSNSHIKRGGRYKEEHAGRLADDDG